MPPGEGWFIDLNTGDHIRFFEHARAVVGDPERFGIHPTEIKGLSPLKDRLKIMRLALSRGFVRVRAHKGEIVMEFDSNNPKTVFPELRRFLKMHGFLGLAQLRVRTLQSPVPCFFGAVREFLAQE